MANFNLSEQERNERLEQIRKNAEERTKKARADHKDQAKQYAKLYARKAEVMQQAAELLPKWNGKPWTKRIADDIDANINGIHAYKHDSLYSRYINISLYNEFRSLGYSDTDFSLYVELDETGRFDATKTLEKAENNIAYYKNKSSEYLNTTKDLEKCIKASKKLKAAIDAYCAEFGEFSRKYDECWISNSYLLNR